MKILQKSVVVIASAVVLSVVGIYAASHLTLLSGYLRIEEADTQANTERAVNVFHDQNRGILISARAYAVWDDMYRAIQNPDPRFIAGLNLNSELFRTHKANFIAILDQNYRPLFLDLLDLRSGKKLPIPRELEGLLEKPSPFMAHEERGPEILGVVEVGGKPMVLASLAGMHTDFSGPPKGAVVFGRFVDDQTVADVGAAAKMTVDFFNLRSEGNPADVSKVGKLLVESGDSPVYSAQALDAERIAGYALVRTMEGHPAFILRILLPRTIYAQGLSSFVYFTLYSALSGLVFLLLLVFILKGLILSRLTGLGKQVRSIKLQDDDSRRVALSGNDEIAVLAQDINRMLASLESERNNLRLANQELEAFSYSLTHHIKAPILSIGGFAGLLKQDHSECLDDKGRHFLQRIADSSASMAKLVGDLIDYSQAGKAGLSPVLLDFSSLSAQVAEEFRSLDPGRKTELMVLPGMTISGDEKLLRKLMVHLFQNAFKFTSKSDPGKIEVGVKRENERKIFFIKDNGAGFDMKYADQLFTPFHTLHSPGEFPGTGLGLAIAQRIIRRHGGRIWAWGEVGRGAAIYFTLEES